MDTRPSTAIFFCTLMIAGMVLWLVWYPAPSVCGGIGCDVQFGRQKPDAKKNMVTWHASLQDWGKWEEMSLDPKHIVRVKSSLAAWMNNKRRLEQQEEPGLISGESKDTRKQKRKEEMKQKVLGEWGPG